MTQELDRKPSFSDQDDILPPVSLLSHQRSFVYDDMIDLKKGKNYCVKNYILAIILGQDSPSLKLYYLSH